MPHPILEVSDLCYKTDGRLLFDGLSLSLYPGERLGVYGRSGSGKSTSLRLLAGLIAPKRGTIWRTMHHA